MGLIKIRSERIAARAKRDRLKDPVERLALRADLLTQRGTALKKLADAIGPLYKSLDDAQKHHFVVLARLERHRLTAWRGTQRGGWMHRGMGNPQRMAPENQNRPPASRSAPPRTGKFVVFQRMTARPSGVWVALGR